MISIVLVGAILSSCSEDPMDQVEYARLTYKANKDAFSFGAFRFEYTIGVSANVADARSGVFKKSIKEDGFYAFDGKNARYELTADPKAVAAVSKWLDSRRSSTLARTVRMLTDGEVTLIDQLYMGRDDTELRHNPQILADTYDYESRFEFPLYVGSAYDRPYDLFRDLTAIKEGKGSIEEVDGNSSLDGVRVCKITFRFKEGKCTYWVDLNRGAVPLQIAAHYSATDLDVLFQFDDVVQVREAGWLPRQMLHVIGNGAAVYGLKVTDIDTRRRPHRSIFQLDFPERVSIVDGARQLAYSARKSWSLLNLPSRTSSQSKPAIPMNILTPPELPGELEPGSSWAVVVIPGLAAAAVAGFLLALKRFRSRFHGG